MESDQKWEIIHNHRRAVRRGLATPIFCNADGVELVPVVGYDGNPALKCLVCRSVLYLGLNDFEAMEAEL